MVRDLMMQIKERDLILADKSVSAMPMFDCVWGNLFDEDVEQDVLICNILIPEAYWDQVKYENGEFICRFISSYYPDTRHFRARLIAFKEGKYQLFNTIRGDFGSLVNSYALSRNLAAPISASMLSYVDLEGQFLVRFIENSLSEVLDKAYIYSAKATDIFVSFNDNQAAQLLSLCGPGKYYRFPTSGVGITSYLNTVIAHSDLYERLDDQFERDNRRIDSAEFDNVTGDLDVLFEPEKEQSDSGLTDISLLNTEFFERFTDEFVRQNTVTSEVDESKFLEILDEYDRMLGLYIFIDNTSSISRIVERYTPGQFNGEGEIIPSDEYYIVSATLEPDSIIMFDDETEDEIKDAPIFIVNDFDETRLYTSLVEQIYWVTEECHKCFVLKKRAEVRYMIRQDKFMEGKGLFLIEQTSTNIKNMLGLVQDVATGRILGIVADNTNISDITMEEITQHIYAIQ